MSSGKKLSEMIVLQHFSEIYEICLKRKVVYQWWGPGNQRAGKSAGPGALLEVTILLHRDVAECCGLHLGKLANIVLACADEFPFFTCPKQTLTPAGIRSLGITIEDVEETLGFPRGCTAVGAAANDELRLKELRSHVDGVDFRALGRLAGLDLPRRRSGLHTFAGQDTFEEVLGEYLTRQIVEGLEERRNRRRG